ncbi:hypothetical protein QCA50_013040 [Cerrena zonata]|uniref:Uncharacterized protein n=1 Tax=Cerrena zonata TaxID=2478898 RepID=A0AAW0FZS1_9APHY
MVLHVYTFLGGLIEGIVVSNILFGLVIAQFYTYTHHWKRDPMWLKCLAVALVLAETTNTVFAQRVQYVHSVLVLDDPVDLTIVDW